MTWTHRRLTALPLLCALALSLLVLAPALILPDLAHAAPSKLSPEQVRSARDAKKAPRDSAEKKTTKKKKKVVRRTTTRRTRVHRGPSYTYGPGPSAVYYYDQGRPAPAPRTSVASSARSQDEGPYFGLGVGALSVNAGSGDAGAGLSLSLGVRSENFGLELGLLGGSQPTTARGELSQELSLGGISGDLRVFLPTGGRFEPYLQAGLGYYSVGVGPEDQSASTAVNLGLGADLRLARSFALGGRYLYHGFWFDQVPTQDQQTDASWSLMGTATIYF
jgi:hypothetical protein